MPKLRNCVAVVAGTVTLGGAALWVTVRPWWHRWGVDPEETARTLSGDEVVSSAPVSDTRGITIDAPPAEVWPWLLQMGFGRAGWYSYDALDMKGSSADRILPDLQALAVGDVMPTHPGGGFEVRVLEPGHALVLYLDDVLVRSQAATAAGGTDRTPANLQAGGALMGAAQPSEFHASWAFVLEPVGDEQTRLIERLRIHFTGGDRPWTKVTLPWMGFGVFLMVRRQLIGIRDRVERNRDRVEPVPTTEGPALAPGEPADPATA